MEVALGSEEGARPNPDLNSVAVSTCDLLSMVCQWSTRLVGEEETWGGGDCREWGAGGADGAGVGDKVRWADEAVGRGKVGRADGAGGGDKVRWAEEDLGRQSFCPVQTRRRLARYVLRPLVHPLLQCGCPVICPNLIDEPLEFLLCCYRSPNHKIDNMVDYEKNKKDPNDFAPSHLCGIHDED